MKHEKLISALEAVIGRLETDSVQYDWSETESCNCGLVVQAIMEIGPSKLSSKLTQLRNKYKLNHDGLTWKVLTTASCPITGIPEDEIMKALYEAGLTAREIVELEYLSNPQIRKRMRKNAGLIGFVRFVFGAAPTSDYNSKSTLIKYLKAWVEILKEESALSQAQVPESNPFTFTKRPPILFINTGRGTGDSSVKEILGEKIEDYGEESELEKRRKLRAELRAMKAEKSRQRREMKRGLFNENGYLEKKHLKENKSPSARSQRRHGLRLLRLWLRNGLQKICLPIETSIWGIFLHLKPT